MNDEPEQQIVTYKIRYRGWESGKGFNDTQITSNKNFFSWRDAVFQALQMNDLNPNYKARAVAIVSWK